MPDMGSRESLGALHPMVRGMAHAMQYKLEANANKKGWPKGPDGQRGWLHGGCTEEFLIKKAAEEFHEFMDALREIEFAANDKRRRELIDKLRLEGADVANVLGMIVDRMGGYRA